jgi:hypothetical protein
MFSGSRRLSLVRFWAFVAGWGVLVLASFLLFAGLIGNEAGEGDTELACAKQKLEAMWAVQLPADAEVVGSLPEAGVVSADWDLKELGCSGAVYPTATLRLHE